MLVCMRSVTFNANNCAMKTIITLTSIFIFQFSIFAQENYSRAKIWFEGKDISTLSNLGLAIDHSSIKKNTFIVSDFSETEIKKAQHAGYKVDILIEDVKAYYVEQAYKPVSRNVVCPNNDEEYAPQVPSNFSLGSMAGYYTYQEYIDILDDMYNQYPTLMTERAPVSDTLTHEGRPLYFVKISNNPQISQAKPKVLYTAIHHAREPGALSETIFFMWYVLENYGTDPEITYLVDELELFFVPMINPDGYIENVTSDPNGGGMFRKNKNPNIGTTNPGVDLNRNYSYEWNTTGVSTDENSDVFPGLSAFSEPETKNIKKIAEKWGVQFALNAHTYSGLMLYPYGSAVNDFTADDSYFSAIGDHMVSYSNYVSQKSSSLYPASGDSDDYLYHDHGIFAITPEVGYDGFWSPAAVIIDDCIDMLFSNIVFAHLPLVYGVTKSLDDYSYINSLSGDFNYSITRLGRTAGDLMVSIEPITGIQSVGNGDTYNLTIEETQTGTISFVLNPSIQYGEEIKYVLVTDNGKWMKRDTITKTYGSPTVQVFDQANSLDNWEGDWDLTNEDYYSPNSSFTDSPNSNYKNNKETYFQFKDTVDLTFADQAFVNFRAKWNVENNYDYVQFLISNDLGNSWIPQCGKYTNTGVSGSGGGQPEEPLYDGVQNSWVLEEISLSEYLGQKILMKFILVSDMWTNEDGFYFDDFKLMYNIDTSLSVEKETLSPFMIYPNPANELIRIVGQELLNGEVHIYNSNGQIVKSQRIEGNSKQTIVNTSELDQGVYFVRVNGSQSVSNPKRLIIVR